MDIVLVLHCNVQYLHHVEGIVKLITVISMHHYALMGLTNGFRIHSKAVYILLRLHYIGHVFLMDCVLKSNVMNARFRPHCFVSSAVRPTHLILHTHTHTCTHSPLRPQVFGHSHYFIRLFFPAHSNDSPMNGAPAFYRERF